MVGNKYNSNISLNRDGVLDFFRGLTAINIVWLHTVAGYGPKAGLFIAMLFDAPLFFFLSGWSAFYSCHFSRVLSRLTRIWILWGCFALILNIFSGIFFAEWDSLGEVTKSIFFIGWTIRSFNRVGDTGWFLGAFLSVVPIVTLFIEYTKVKNWKFKNFLSIISVLCIGVGYLTFYPGGVFYFLPRRVMFYSIFYLLGYAFMTYKVKISVRMTMVLSIICVLLWLLSAKLLSVDLFNVQAYKFPIPSIVYLFFSMVSVIMVWFLSRRNFNVEQRGVIKIVRFIRWIGENAICFYLAQAIGDQLIGYVFPELKMPFILRLCLAFVVSFSTTILVGSILIVLNKGINRVVDEIINRMEKSLLE